MEIEKFPYWKQQRIDTSSGSVNCSAHVKNRIDVLFSTGLIYSAEH